MDWIYKIAYHQNIRNQIPNQELAKELAALEDSAGIKEINSYLFDKNKSIASDCIKVLYEIGYIKPELISNYYETYLNLLSSKNNRMIWGGMIALSTISTLKADEIYKNIDLIIETIDKGTVITKVSGIKVLVGIAIAKSEYKEKLFPVLLNYLENCRPVDFASRVETYLPLISELEEKNAIEHIIRIKKEELSNAQNKKLISILNKYHKKNKFNINYEF